jgi:integrase
MATKVVRIISGLGNWGTDEGRLPASPAKGIRTFKPTERDRVLTDDEIAVLWRACDRLGYPYQIPKLLLLCAARVREIGQLPWDELNLDFRVWALPGNRSKNGQPLTLHLSRPAVAELRELAAQRATVPALKASPYVFVGANGGRIESFSHMKEKLDEAMAEEAGGPVAHFELRDLRRTAASTMARLKVSPVAVEKILNHQKGETIGGPIAKIYNRFDYQDECAEALDRLGEFISGLASPKIVPLRRA